MMDKLQVLDADTLLRQVEGLYPEALEQVRRVVAYAIQAHGDQLRASGESFMVHPLAVAGILAELHMDTPTIVAGVLHDVVEDTDIPIEEVREQFGDEVALLVEGVSKLRKAKLKSKVEEVDLDEEQAENLRKMFLAMVDDIRVVIIKLSDRLHNIRTLQYMPPDKQLRKARETLDIYAPLAERLGIWQLKWQLEDLSFRYIDPEGYREIAELLAQRRAERAEYLDRVITVIREQLEEEGIQARLSSRPKHIYSIHKKMQEKSRDFGQIYDVHGVRIIVDKVRDCYHALGIIHSLWRPIPGEFDDYIAMPKDNLYQSLHTAVVALDGRPLEVQIRTEEMHQVAEYGVAAHWRYKEGAKRDETLEARVNWLRQASDWREEVEDAQQFVDSLKSDVIAERVYVFTPKGDIIDLPSGATPIDFAYEIHTEIGHRCRGAKVDGRLVSLDYQLHNGEQVEILAVKDGGPSRDWLNPQLNYVATQRARQKISHWFRRQQREQNIADGREILDREMRRLGIDQETYAEIAALFKYGSVQDFMAAVGYGDISPSQIAKRIDEAADKSERLRLKAIPDTPITDIQVMGVGDLLTRMAPCCKPVPGDAIVGYTTRGKGITVHRSDCPNIVHLQDVERLIPVSWGKPQQAYPVPVVVEAFDRSGLLRDIASAVADLGLSMSSANVSSNHDSTATIRITVGVRGVGQLSALLNKLQSVRDVLDARRERTA
jgi:GTP diphosphokinase / guanosine-3',5'-bis(diphosphate) 3'-diphosphatase